MVNTKLIKETIKELMDANVDQDTIYSTLKDIGVDQEDIEKYYLETKKEVEESIDLETEEIEEEPEEKQEKKVNKEETDQKEQKNIAPQPQKKELPKKIDDQKTIKNEDDLKETTKNVEKINENNYKIETKINDYEKSLDNKEILEIKNRISKIEEDITDIKAEIKALNKIMKDILEENRKILNKL